MRAFGRLDILVNNAGIETRTSTLETTEAQFDMVIAVDLKSAFFGVQAAARQMITQGGGGRIINISSIHEDWPMPGNALLPGQGRHPDADPDRRRRAGAARDHGRRCRAGRGPHADRRSDARQPGAEYEARGRDPASGRVAEPEEIARLVAFLASDEASYGTATTYVADGGMMQASVGL